MGYYSSRLFKHPSYEQYKHYWENHEAAINLPKGVEVGLISLLKGWLRYADEYEKRYESSIGKDMILGPCWARIGESLLGMLNGELGRLDGGSLDNIIRETLKDEGFGDE